MSKKDEQVKCSACPNLAFWYVFVKPEGDHALSGWLYLCEDHFKLFGCSKYDLENQKEKNIR